MQRLSPLFNKYQIFAVIDQRRNGLREAVAKLSPAELGKDHSEMAEELAARYSIKVPVLREDQIEVTDEEIQIDVSGDPMRVFLDRSRPFYVPGVRVTIHIPFDGDGWLFEVLPSTHTMNPPRGEVHGEELRLILDVLPERQASLKAEIDQTIAKVKNYLNWLTPSAQQLAGELKLVASQELSQRQQQLESQSKLVSSLGFPKRTKGPAE